LIKKFGIPKTRKTKTGYSMDASSLENLINTKGLHSDVYKISEGLIKYRELTKLKSTYIDSLPKQINLKTGKIHSNFNQIGSSTGRLSSNNPNIQNIPIRTDLGREVRKSFTSNYKNGWQLLAADYSQIELRILADLSEEKSLIESFNNNEDIHSSTAKIMYEVEKVSLEQRRIAKILNFGVIYGLGPLGISRQTNLSKDQGKKFIDIYFGKYSGIRKYIDEQKLKVSQNGYAETLTGRRRYLPDINSPNQRIKAGAERIAINMPIQGTAADLIKIAMINIYQELKIQKMSSILIAQVHDELIFEIAPGELMEMQSIVVTLMKSAMNLKIPLEVEIKTGPTWGDME
jgi:DNA polymerase-1